MEAWVSDFDSVKKGLELYLTDLVRAKGYITLADVYRYRHEPEPECQSDWTYPYVPKPEDTCILLDLRKEL